MESKSKDLIYFSAYSDFQCVEEKIAFIRLDKAAEVLAEWIYQYENSWEEEDTGMLMCDDFKYRTANLQQEYINRALEELKK